MPAPPLVLAFTTTTDACGVALRRGERLAEAVLHRSHRHAERLVPLARDLLTHAGARVADLDAVALAAGPGSYTGLRIGASTAKGIARSTGAALVAVPTLTALAEATRSFSTAGDLIFPVLRSRRGEVYAAGFRREDDRFEPLAQAEAAPTEAVAAHLRTLLGDASPTAERWLVGPGAPRLAEALAEDSAGRSSERPPARVVEDAAPSAAAVARLGTARFNAGIVEDFASFEPRYLKEVHVTPRPRPVFEGLS